MIPHPSSRMTLARAIGLCALLLAVSVSGVQAREMTVKGKEFEFIPDHMEMVLGDDLVITFENTGKVSHNITFPKLDTHTETIQAGNTTKLTISPEKAGTYKYKCTVPGHAQAGMRGELVVKEN